MFHIRGIRQNVCSLTSGVLLKYTMAASRFYSQPVSQRFSIHSPAFEIIPQQMLWSSKKTSLHRGEFFVEKLLRARETERTLCFFLSLSPFVRDYVSSLNLLAEFQCFPLQKYLFKKPWAILYIWYCILKAWIRRCCNGKEFEKGDIYKTKSLCCTSEILLIYSTSTKK